MSNRVAPRLALTFALAGAAIVLAATARWGAGVSPDSVTYISVARSLISDRGFTTYAGDPLVEHAPVYPMILAGAAIVTRLDPGVVAGACNALFFALTILLVARLLPRCFPRDPLIWTSALVATVVSIPLQRVAGYAWTESFFILCVMAGANSLSDYLRAPAWREIVAFGVVAGLAATARYPGVVLIAWGVAVVVLLGRTRWNVRVAHAIVLVLLALAPAVPWYARNLELSGSIVGYRAPSAFGWGAVTFAAGWTLAKWFAPLAAAIVVGAVIKRLRRRGDEPTEHDTGPDRRALWNPQLSSVAIFSGIYLGAMVLASVRFAHDPLGDRLLSPAYLPLALMLLAAMNAIGGSGAGADAERRHRFIRRAGVGLWLAYQIAFVSIRVVGAQIRDGAGYASPAWKESPTIRYVQTTGDEFAGTSVYSNGADVLYWIAGLRAAFVPRTSMYNSSEDVTSPTSLVGEWPPSNGKLVWFDALPRPYLFDLQDLEITAVLDRGSKFEDGAVFDVARR